MKYFLAVDKGKSFDSDSNFRKIDLGKDLEQENNLKALCDFTGSYLNGSELKEALNERHLLATNEMHYNLVIGYKKDSYRFIAVPYQKEHEYLDCKKLEETIHHFAQDKEALQVIISYYSNFGKVYNIQPELYSFRVFISNPYEDYKFYDVIRRFVDKVCYRIDHGKKTLNFRRMYDLAMLVSKLVPSKVEKQEKEVPNQSIAASKPRMDSVVYHEYEELLYRLEQLSEKEKNMAENEIPGQRRLY